MELLREVFKKIFTEEVKACSLAFYYEKEAYPFLRPKPQFKWDLKDKRPLKVLEANGEEVLFVLLSTKSGFGCPDEPFKGITEDSSAVNLSACAVVNERCGWVDRGLKAFVFKRPHGGLCYLWALPAEIFKKLAVVCGPCQLGFFSKEMESVLKEEIKKEVQERIVMSKKLCELLRKLADGSIKPKEYGQLRQLLCYIMVKTGSSLDILLNKETPEKGPENILQFICGERPSCTDYDPCIQDLLSDLILKKLLPYVKTLTALEDAPCRSYVYRAVKSFLVDAYRQKKKEPPISDLMEYLERLLQDEGQEDTELIDFILKEKFKELYNLSTPELFELVRDFIKSIRPEEVKYFCYLLVPDGKKLYKCLWGDKKEGAVYKDVSRKRDLVVKYLETLRDAGYDKEVVELFIKTVLSDLCEALRYKVCKEGQL